MDGALRRVALEDAERWRGGPRTPYPGIGIRLMRIVLGVHQFFPENSYGTEVLTLSFARCLKAAGHDVLVVTGCPWRRTQTDVAAVEPYTFEGIEVRRLLRAGQVTSAQSKLSRQYLARELDTGFSALLSGFAPNVIHMFHLQNLSVSLLEIASAFAPTFFTATDFWLICPLGLMRLEDGVACGGPNQDRGNCVRHLAELSPGMVGRLARSLPIAAFSAGLRVSGMPGIRHLGRVREARALQERATLIEAALARVEKIFVPTEYLANALVNDGVPRSKLVRMMYGIDSAGQGSLRPALSEGPIVRFGFIGSMTEHKGAHILVSAFRRLAPALPAKLTVFGASPESAYTRRLQSLAGDDPRITFRPTFAPAQIGAALDEIDCLVIPSLWSENAPLVALSAQLAGRAILASNVPGLSEAASTAQFFNAGNIDDLECNLTRLCKHPELMREQIGKQPLPKSIAQMVDETLESYRESLALGPAASPHRCEDGCRPPDVSLGDRVPE